MSARQQNNVMHVAVGGNAAKTTANFPKALNQYEVGLFLADGTRMTQTNASGAAKFMIAVGGANSKPAFVSDIIKVSDVKRISHKAYSAATSQVDYVGYNGSAQSIDAIDNNLYMVQVYLEEFITSSHDGRYIKHFQYKSDSSATQSEIALGLAKSAYLNFSREAKNSAGDPFATFKAICSDAGAIIPTGAGTVAVNKGSNVIEFGTDVDDATGATLLLVNEFLRFGTTVTSPVYKIVSIDTTANTIVLDRPYGETSNSAVANNAVERITAALGLAADWGVAITASAKDHSVGQLHYGVTRFTINAKDFGSTVSTKSVAASEGTGVINQMKDLEWFAKGNSGDIYRDDAQAGHRFVQTVDAQGLSDGFDMVTIEYTDEQAPNFQVNVSPKSLSILIPELTSGSTAPAYAVTGTTDDITDCLEVLLAGKAAYTEANSFDGTGLTTSDLAMG